MTDTPAEPLPLISLTTDTAPVLDQHCFDQASLERFMGRQLADFSPPMQVGQIRGGMSNPTFVLTDAAGRRYVLRKKPPGKLLPSAHAVDREFRVISALRNTVVPVAKPYVLCQDPSVIGTDFYLMDFIDGRVLRGYELGDMPPAERRRVYAAMVEAIASLHRVDFRAVGLEEYGRVDGYMARQVSRWTKQYAASKTERIPEMEWLMAWLPEHLPADDQTTISHGDFRLENLIFHPTEPRVLAVVDWELSTLGAPFADLAHNCLPYHVPDESRGDITRLDYADYGIPSEADYVARYCELTGRDRIPHWTFYIVFALFRIGAIIQGVYKRGLDGNASSPQALSYKEQCRQMAAAAWGLVQRGLE